MLQSETNEAANLRKILMALDFSKPPPNLTIQTIIEKVIPKTETAINKGGLELLGKPIFNSTLSDKQWNTLSGVQKDLHQEYTIRREMLLKRLDCTIQSFQVNFNLM